MLMSTTTEGLLTENQEKKKKQMQILAHGQNSLERALKKLKKHQKQ